MIQGRYSFPARLEPDEDGRLVVHFPDLPEALTDGANEAEALPRPPIAYRKRSPVGSTAARTFRRQAGCAPVNT